MVVAARELLPRQEVLASARGYPSGAAGDIPQVPVDVTRPMRTRRLQHGAALDHRVRLCGPFRPTDEEVAAVCVEVARLLAELDAGCCRIEIRPSH